MFSYHRRIGVCLVLALMLLHPVRGRSQTDEREAAPRTPAERVFILREMRLFLGSVQAISVALSTGDTATAAVEAAARGRRANATLAKPAGLDARETPAWKGLMGGARKGFDAVADISRSGAPAPQILGVLGETMKNCVACHESYRLTDVGE